MTNHKESDIAMHLTANTRRGFRRVSLVLGFGLGKVFYVFEKERGGDVFQSVSFCIHFNVRKYPPQAPEGVIF